MSKKRKQKTEPAPVLITWRRGEWLRFAGWLSVARQNALAEDGPGSELAKWISGLSSHVRLTCDKAAQAAGDITAEELEDLRVQVALKKSTYDWIVGAGFVFPPPPTKPNPEVAKTAARVRRMLKTGEIRLD